jgi:hypothetical protein
VTIHLGGALLRRSCGLPGSEPSKSQTSNFETRDLKGLKRTAFNTASLFGLAPQGACLAEPVARLAGEAFTSPFHHRPRRSASERVRAVCSLLRYSVGSPRLAVSQPAVLWCSDFPPAFRMISNLKRNLKSPRRGRSPGLLRNDQAEYNRRGADCGLRGLQNDPT